MENMILNNINAKLLNMELFDGKCKMFSTNLFKVHNKYYFNSQIN